MLLLLLPFYCYFYCCFFCSPQCKTVQYEDVLRALLSRNVTCLALPCLSAPCCVVSCRAVSFLDIDFDVDVDFDGDTLRQSNKPAGNESVDDESVTDEQPLHQKTAWGREDERTRGREDERRRCFKDTTVQYRTRQDKR